MSKEYNSALQARVEQFLKEKNICFTPQWSSFRALKRHFCANNQCDACFQR